MSTDGVYTIVCVHILHSLPLLCTVMYALLTVDITHKACYSANSADMKEILYCVCSGLPSSSTSVTRDESKIKKIVAMYRKRKVSVPRNRSLENSFDNMMGRFRAFLLAADSEVISNLLGVIQFKYRRCIHGVRPAPLPPIPDTAKGLYDFIAVKSTPYEVHLVDYAIDVLGNVELKEKFQEYISKLCDFFQETFSTCNNQRVVLPLRKNHTPIAVAISKEQVLLSLVLEMKEYFSEYLQLEETLFEGFEEGCTVLFFSILTVDAALLSPKVLSHLSELKRMFGMTHLIVFGYFACDLEKATIELVVSVCVLHVLCTRDVPGLEWTRPKPPF